MVTKLLVLADQQGYYRFSSGSPKRCSMEKATVFPFDTFDDVKNKQEELLASGVEGVIIKLLTITEEEYTG